MGLQQPLGGNSGGFRQATRPARITRMKIFLGSDHQGFELKQELFAYLSKNGYDVEDVGNRTLDANDDDPQFAQMAALKVLGEDGPDARAILVCGGGQGMAIAANRFRG